MFGRSIEIATREFDPSQRPADALSSANELNESCVQSFPDVGRPTNFRAVAGIRGVKKCQDCRKIVQAWVICVKLRLNIEGRAMASQDALLSRLDTVVDDFCRRTRYFKEPMTPARAKMFVMQHRQNTRHRNSVLKLKVATNCPDWDTRLNIIGACSQEVIADHEHGHGKAHWQILEELGTYIGMSLDEIRSAKLLDSTAIAWAAWEGLMANRHWLEGIVANTCAERANVPGYGEGVMRKSGWFGLERQRWGELFKLTNAQLDFFELHEQADIEHSDMGWQAIARFSRDLHMEDAVVEACRRNLLVWGASPNGIAPGGGAPSLPRPFWPA